MDGIELAKRAEDHFPSTWQTWRFFLLLLLFVCVWFFWFLFVFYLLLSSEYVTLSYS